MISGNMGSLPLLNSNSLLFSARSRALVDLIEGPPTDQVRLSVTSRTPESLPAAVPSTPAPPAAAVARFGYEGLTQAGFYTRVQGEDGSLLTMKREPKYIDVGGFLVESDPLYHIQGQVQGVDLRLDVASESQISDVGGIQVQTGTIYHVSGQRNGQDYQATIESKSEITNFGGMAVETGSQQTLTDSDGQLTSHSVSEISHVGGMAVETGVHHDLRSSRGQATLRGYQGKTRQLEVDGDLPAEQVALVVALRPFLA